MAQDSSASLPSLQVLGPEHHTCSAHAVGISDIRQCYVCTVLMGLHVMPGLHVRQFGILTCCKDGDCFQRTCTAHARPLAHLPCMAITSSSAVTTSRGGQCAAASAASWPASAPAAALHVPSSTTRGSSSRTLASSKACRWGWGAGGIRGGRAQHHHVLQGSDHHQLTGTPAGVYGTLIGPSA
jgi:hypothetical protein